MADYRNDDEKFTDPYSTTAPVDSTPRVRETGPVPPGPGRGYATEPADPRGSRAGSAFIPILLLALVIAGAWWLMRTAPEQRGTETAATTGYEAGPQAGVPGVVGAPDTVGTAGAGTGLVGVEAGDDVHLHDARITALGGERTFWIAAGAGDRMLVLAPHTTGMTGQIGDRREGFRAGQTVAIEGRIEAAGSLSTEGLSAADQNALQSADGLILRAIRVTGL
ncbi:MAG: hypothetical protein H0T05_01350 [Acidobacteria bacterium]|nr:hypothetical protein [Acidobacteriota bacterium]MBA3886614.1 hypothetical protein [Acidobacteriota bacterium]